ncbi:hypothetical protein, partial [Escherichia coli]
MDRKIICLTKTDTDDIDFYLRVGEYTDEEFNYDYGLNVKKKNKIYIPINLKKRKEYRYLNYIDLCKLEASFLLKLIIDLYKTMGENNPAERERVCASILSIEDTFMSIDKDYISKINYTEIQKSDFINLPPRILGIIE